MNLQQVAMCIILENEPLTYQELYQRMRVYTLDRERIMRAIDKIINGSAVDYNYNVITFKRLQMQILNGREPCHLQHRRL